MSDKQPSTIKEVAKMLSELSTKVDQHSANLQAEMQGIRESITVMSILFDGYKTTQEAIKKEQSVLRKENKELRDALITTKKAIAILELKQYSRQGNLEIKGLPLKPDENLEEAVIKLEQKLEVPVSSADVGLIHPVPCKDKHKPNVVVKFASRSVRDSVLQAAKKKNLVSADFDHDGTDTAYINEHLCPEKISS